MNIEKLKFPIGEFQKPISISDSDTEIYISVIENFPNKLQSLTENLSVEELNWKYRPDGWMIKQVVHHCADSHMNSFIRFKLAITEENPIIKPYQEAAWAQLPDGNSYNLKASLQILEGVHARWTLLLKSFSKNEFEKQFLNPESKKNYKLNETLALYAWHCNHHLAHIEQALLLKNKF